MEHPFSTSNTLTDDPDHKGNSCCGKAQQELRFIVQQLANNYQLGGFSLTSYQFKPANAPPDQFWQLGSFDN